MKPAQPSRRIPPPVVAWAVEDSNFGTATARDEHDRSLDKVLLNDTQTASASPSDEAQEAEDCISGFLELLTCGCDERNDEEPPTVVADWEIEIDEAEVEGVACEAHREEEHAVFVPS